MQRSLSSLLFWAPRILTILFAVFLSIFALDVFSEGYGLAQAVVALFMHLIPTLLVVVMLLVAWRWEWVGAVLFLAGGAFYVYTAGENRSAILVIAGPMFLASGLFLLGWFLREKRGQR